MTTFDFSYIVSGIDPHSDSFEDRFFEAGCDDATLMLLKGSVVASFAREADTYTDAVVSAYFNLLQAGADVDRFDPDFLVTKSEIATRASISRQAVSHYVSGDRGQGFPQPIARFTSNSPLWDWVEVSDWLYKKEQVSQSVYRQALVGRGMNNLLTRTEPKTLFEDALHKKAETALLAA